MTLNEPSVESGIRKPEFRRGVFGIEPHSRVVTGQVIGKTQLPGMNQHVFWRPVLWNVVEIRIDDASECLLAFLADAGAFSTQKMHGTNHRIMGMDQVLERTCANLELNGCHPAHGVNLVRICLGISVVTRFQMFWGQVQKTKLARLIQVANCSEVPATKGGYFLRKRHKLKELIKQTANVGVHTRVDLQLSAKELPLEPSLVWLVLAKLNGHFVSPRHYLPITIKEHKLQLDSESFFVRSKLDWTGVMSKKFFLCDFFLCHRL